LEKGVFGCLGVVAGGESSDLVFRYMQGFPRKKRILKYPVTYSANHLRKSTYVSCRIWQIKPINPRLRQRLSLRRLCPDLRAVRHWIWLALRRILDHAIRDPFLDSANITAFVNSVEVGKRVRDVFDPVVRDDAHVGVAEDILAEHFNAVVCGVEFSECFSWMNGWRKGREELTNVNLNGELPVLQPGRPVDVLGLLVVVSVERLSQNIEALYQAPSANVTNECHDPSLPGRYTYMHMMAHFQEADIATAVLGCEFGRTLHVHIHRRELFVREASIFNWSGSVR
jgi:hypothetical protein